jgi:hypothetical protein
MVRRGRRFASSVRGLDRTPANVFTDETTAHPALIPHEAPGDPRRHPQIPATRWAERPAPAGNPRLSPLSPDAP